MIQPLRRAHLRIWSVLVVLLPLLVALSLFVRRPTTPANRNLSWELRK
jgi:hypothetical protein